MASEVENSLHFLTLHCFSRHIFYKIVPTAVGMLYCGFLLTAGYMNILFLIDTEIFIL